MLDHVALNVSDLEKSKAFYVKALAPMGLTPLASFPGWVGFGKDGKSVFWLASREPYSNGAHIAFACERRSMVDGFYDGAMSAGGRDNGKPGLRADYHADYYGAFVYDPDGNNVEAVCHKAE